MSFSLHGTRLTLLTSRAIKHKVLLNTLLAPITQTQWEAQPLIRQTAGSNIVDWTTEGWRGPLQFPPSFFFPSTQSKMQIMKSIAML